MKILFLEFRFYLRQSCDYGITIGIFERIEQPFNPVFVFYQFLALPDIILRAVKSPNNLKLLRFPGNFSYQDFQFFRDCFLFPGCREACYFNAAKRNFAAYRDLRIRQKLIYLNAALNKPAGRKIIFGKIRLGRSIFRVFCQPIFMEFESGGIVENGFMVNTAEILVSVFIILIGRAIPCKSLSNF